MSRRRLVSAAINDREGRRIPVINEDAARVAEILRRQLRAAIPEHYRFTWELVWEMHTDFSDLFSSKDPEFLPERFRELIFEDYPVELYG